MSREPQPNGEGSGRRHRSDLSVGAARLGAVRRLALRVTKAAVWCALMLGSAEVAGVVYLRVVQGLDGDAVRREKAAIYERLPTLQYMHDRPEQPVLNQPRELHPFFAFVLQRGRPPSNNHGFWNDVDFPYHPQDGELVVGVFGGSVAVQMSNKLSAGRRVLEQRFSAMAAQRGFTSARVLSLAESGWRQPQSFYTFTYYLDMVDVALFLDGFNEVDQLFPTRWPTRFPWADMWRALSRAGQSPEELVLAGEISGISRLARTWTELISGPITGRSAILHCAWRLGAARILKALDYRRRRLVALQAKQTDYSSLQAATPEEEVQQQNDYYEFYERLARTQGETARREGVAYYHFIQPSRLVRNSKPWSAEEELQRAPYYESRVEKITSSYERLEDMIERLAGSGISAHNLRDVFRDVPETVYRDETVHLNPEGLSLLAHAMMDLVERDFSQQPLRRSPQN